VSSDRRSFFRHFAVAAGAVSAVGVSAQPSLPGRGRAGAAAGRAPAKFQTLDVPHLPFTMDGGTKVFHLRAEPVRTEFVPGRVVDAWGFNGSVPGPTIEVTEGDRVRIILENRLPEMFAPHWHGLEVPVAMDGTPGISQPPIRPGESFTYEFTLTQNGTFFYHSHMAMQEMMGMIGFFVIHPRVAYEPLVDHDFGVVLQEWMIHPNNTVPNTLSMEYNWLTMNGKSAPATTPIVVKQGERVRIRMINMGMDHHPIHLHGMQFVVTGTEAGRADGPFRMRENTVLVGVAQARDIEFVATNPGDWMLHCHLPHHMMNQMASMVGPMMVDPLQPSAKVAGFPQDMWMPIDGQAGSKPELYGLPPSWTGAMMGMMTLVRVVTPAMYSEIERLRVAAGKEAL
jgi:FtsP/CotA-like multicopper oxidase with cupredoxin domain